jgi:hypothetical protein
MIKARIFVYATLVLLIASLSFLPALPAEAANRVSSFQASGQPGPRTPLSPAPTDAPVAPPEKAKPGSVAPPSSAAVQPIHSDSAAVDENSTDAGLGDLTPYIPSGWSNPIVPSATTGTTTTGTLYTYQNTYVDWSIVNNGAAITAPFYTCLYLDGMEQMCWYHSSGLPAGYYSWVSDYQLSATITTGWHTLGITADATNLIAETNEGNNTWEASFYWNGPTQPDLVPYTPAGWDYPLVPTSGTGTTTVGLLTSAQTYLDWAVMNNGTATTTGFYTCVYLDGTEIVCSNHANGLGQGYYSYVMDWLVQQQISPGNHTLRLVVDAYNNVVEANETNNTWETVFYWAESCPASSYAPAPNEMGGTIQADTFPRPADVQARIDAARLQAQSDPRSNAPGKYDTSSYLAGSVAIGIVLPESAGNMENWTEIEMNCVVSKIQDGLAWWQSRSAPQTNLSFVYDVHKAVPTQYEPIDMSDSDVGLWISETMGAMGFSGTDSYERVYNYTDYLRSTYHTQWAVVYFVADSSNDPDGKFKDSQYFGWTNIGGPYIMMTYDNDGWGIDDMNWVAAHEFGHDFGAGDQYYAPGYGGCASTTERYGYLGVVNSNCEYNNPNSVPSLMRSNEDALDATAAGQVGWLDSNANGTYDVIETQPAFQLTSHTPDPTIETAWSYSGYVFDQPWPHAVCGTYDACNYHDITINTITAAEFRVDGGSWYGVTPVDGTFDSDFEQITFNTPSLAAGVHTIDVWAANSRGVTRTWSDTVTIQSCYTVTTAASPAYAGSATVTTAPNCGTRYAPGTSVSISAAANAGYSFGSWSGDASGGASPVTLTVSGNRSVTANFNNRAPTLSSTLPASATAGGSAFTLNLTGTNFVQGSVARWNGANLATTYTNSTTLSASVPASSIASAGTVSVTVYNPTPGGGTSSGVTFTINNPAPALSGLNPNAVTAASGGFTLTVNGSGFVNTSTVRWNGANLATTFVNPGQLTAAVPAGNLTASGTVAITVYSPTPGGGTSGAQTFTINNPIPAVSGLNPSSAIAGGASFTLTVNGSNFVGVTQVRLNGVALATTYVSSSQVRATVPAASIATAGTAAITVFNPAPGGGTGGSATLEINNPLPTLTSLDPAQVLAGRKNLVLVVRGAGFAAGATVRWNGLDLATTYVNATTLTATVPDGYVASGGTALITVRNPSPGGGVSTGLSFQIVTYGLYLPHINR